MTMNKPLKFVFTGGCYSGKTTSMNIIKKILEEKGKKVIYLDELIRRYDIGSIDDIRNNPNAYMDLQYEIITAKMESEIEADELINSNICILIDRAVTDSLFYLTFYVSKNSLDEEHQQKFIKLFNKLNSYLIETPNIYDYIFEFTPIKKLEEQDTFRPKNLKDFQHIEYEMIKKYNKIYYDSHPGFMTIDLNNIPLKDVENFWREKLEKIIK